MTSTNPSSAGDLSTEQLEKLVSQPDLPPEQRRIYEDELTQRMTREFRGGSGEPAPDPPHRASPPHAGSGKASPDASVRHTGTSGTKQAAANVPNFGQTATRGGSPAAPTGMPTKRRSHAGLFVLALVLVIGAGVGSWIAIAQGRHSRDVIPTPTTAPPSILNSGSSQPQPFPATVSVPSGQVANVYANPTADSTILGTLGNGNSVLILCTTQGEVVTGNGHSSGLWDNTKYGYIPDVNVYTGTDQPTMPSC